MIYVAGATKINLAMLGWFDVGNNLKLSIILSNILEPLTNSGRSLIEIVSQKDQNHPRKSQQQTDLKSAWQNLLNNKIFLIWWHSRMHLFQIDGQSFVQKQADFK